RYFLLMTQHWCRSPTMAPQCSHIRVPAIARSGPGAVACASAAVTAARPLVGTRSAGGWVFLVARSAAVRWPPTARWWAVAGSLGRPASILHAPACASVPGVPAPRTAARSCAHRRRSTSSIRAHISIGGGSARAPFLLFLPKIDHMAPVTICAHMVVTVVATKWRTVASTRSPMDHMAHATGTPRRAVTGLAPRPALLVSLP
ncbi:hypothetical protein GNI_188140, partial [Gregarina niphandrodes]